ncbi:MAG: urea carboxylase-associated family protein, partial [Granulosicoccus sp.]|nr:urea carboxylase-associated family protein [Granulosicoccus sp.]
IGHKLPAIPAPFNIWMNIPIGVDGSIRWKEPVSEPGDIVRFRALVDCIAVMSACPQDMTPVNGENTEPAELTFLVDSVLPDSG